MIFASFFIFYSTVSQKMDHFDISFACSIFSKSWEVTNYGFLGVAHLPLSHHLQVTGTQTVAPRWECADGGDTEPWASAARGMPRNSKLSAQLAIGKVS